MKLSAFFSLEELTFSETAERNHIDNALPAELMPNLKRLAYSLDEIRAELERPIHINSGFRCPALEKIIVGDAFPRWCGKHGLSPDDPQAWLDYLKTKAHPRALAADFVSREYGSPVEICRAIEASVAEFDQLIYEHSWVHFGLASEGVKPRREVLTLMPDGGYAVGIVER